MLLNLQVNQMQQEHDKKQLSLIAEHNEQLKRAQLQAENELREVPHTLTRLTEPRFVYKILHLLIL